jgi:hypothetical protein
LLLILRKALPRYIMLRWISRACSVQLPLVAADVPAVAITKNLRYVVLSDLPRAIVCVNVQFTDSIADMYTPSKVGVH